MFSFKIVKTRAEFYCRTAVIILKNYWIIEFGRSRLFKGEWFFSFFLSLNGRKISERIKLENSSCTRRRALIIRENLFRLLNLAKPLLFVFINNVKTVDIAVVCLLVKYPCQIIYSKNRITNRRIIFKQMNDSIKLIFKKISSR